MKRRKMNNVWTDTCVQGQGEREIINANKMQSNTSRTMNNARYDLETRARGRNTASSPMQLIRYESVNVSMNEN